jgi:16S rRNA (uracil1498-N3)-methyltransferase
MARANATLQRLYVEADLSAGGTVALPDKQAHYLRNVLRLDADAEILLFNGRDGEWQGALQTVSKKAVIVRLERQTRAQETAGDIWLLVAPVKKDRLDYLAQKATEMGAAHLMPVLTKRTQGKNGVKPDKLRANVIEAAEQCNIICVPHVHEVEKLTDVLAAWPSDRTLIFCDETAPSGTGAGEWEALAGAKLAVLIGPEGGFDAAERAALMARPEVVSLSLGPRILRTDTAVVAALALVQAKLGDW